MELNKVIKTLLATASLGAILALTPISLDFGGHDGLSVKVSQAFAKDGNSGSDDSGSGSDDGGSDDGGSDDDDDNSGSGGGDDDSDGDSSGRDEPRIPGGSGCDDAGDIAEHPECGGAAGGGAGGAGGQSEFFLTDGTKVEISNGGLNIEVKYPDGSKEEIQFGRYERKDTNNTTVEERSATAEDFARIQAIING